MSRWHFVVAFLLQAAHAQIRVLSPDYLVQAMATTKGKIQGSTATFGAPFYGDRVLGRLVWGNSKGHHHCSDEDYDVPKLDVVHSTESKAHDQVRLINIIMVRRGECSFVTKVKVASKKGAHAVIIVDREDSRLTSHDLQNIIVADDGYGNTISIPSILISKFDGAALISAAKKGEAIVELSWNIPTGQVVALDLWMNSAAPDTQKFLKEFSAVRKTLNSVVKFTPHYHVFSTDPALGGYSGLCSDTSAKYCAEDPDGGGLVSGKDVLEEDVRQLCIHEITRIPRSSTIVTEGMPKNPLKQGTPIVFYAEQWWDYVGLLPDRCKVDSDDVATRFGKVCSEALMKEVGIDVVKVDECVIRSKDKKLDSELVNKAWSPRALRVNGWRYKGMMEADLVTRAICSGFVKQPAECEDLLKPRDPVQKYKGTVDGGGISTRFLMVFALTLVMLSFCILWLYRRYLAKTLGFQIREQVMLEVTDAMSGYSKI